MMGCEQYCMHISEYKTVIVNVTPNQAQALDHCHTALCKTANDFTVKC